jgi:hypothetical protein
VRDLFKIDERRKSMSPIKTPKGKNLQRLAEKAPAQPGAQNANRPQGPADDVIVAAVQAMGDGNLEAVVEIRKHLSKGIRPRFGVGDRRSRGHLAVCRAKPSHPGRD